LGDCHFGQVFKKTAALALIFGNFFFSVKDTYVLILNKNVLSSFWGNFSQTHLVTLARSNMLTRATCHSTVNED
jgi:hypothetical protein